jgi:hypothetical protein
MADDVDKVVTMPFKFVTGKYAEPSVVIGTC